VRINQEVFYKKIRRVTNGKKECTEGDTGQKTERTEAMSGDGKMRGMQHAADSLSGAVKEKAEKGRAAFKALWEDGAYTRDEGAEVLPS